MSGRRDAPTASRQASRTGVVIEPLGDAALLLRWASRIDAGIVRDVHAVSRALRASAPPWVRDIVPAYASLAVFLDIETLALDAAAFDRAREWCERALAGSPVEDRAGDDVVEIPVRYGGEHGPDLALVAAHAGLGEAEVIARHVAADYRVAMLGFSPGFPYLVGLDSALVVPRRVQPRLRVAAGSVGIGGAQTGVYPRESPGGWQIIGRTQQVLFDPRRAPPSLLQPGDRVRFVAIA